MTLQPSPDLAALSELLVRVNAVAQRLGPESITDALRQYPHAHPKYREGEFAHDLRALLAAARRVPELEKENATLREQTGWEDLPLCEHGVGIFGDRIKCAACDAERRADSLQAQLDEAKGEIGLLKSQYDQIHALAVEAATNLKAAEARANAAEERVRGPLMGLHEAAKLYGFTKQAVYNRLHRGTMPKSLVQLQNGPIWAASDLIAHKARLDADKGALLPPAGEPLK